MFTRYSYVRNCAWSISLRKSIFNDTRWRWFLSLSLSKGGRGYPNLINGSSFPCRFLFSIKNPIIRKIEKHEIENCGCGHPHNIITKRKYTSCNRSLCYVQLGTDIFIEPHFRQYMCLQMPYSRARRQGCDFFRKCKKKT